MKILKNRFGQIVTVSVASVGSAMAAVPAEVSSALTTAQTDGVTIAGIVLGVIVAIAAFKYIRRAL